MFPRRLIAAVTLVVAAACRLASAASPLSGGEASVEALVAQYADAVARGDTARMHALRVTEREHNELLWPQFPASRPEFNMPVSFAWENLDRRSRRDALRIVQDYGGQPLDVVAVSCQKGVTDYGTFSVHGDCWVTLRRPTTGEQRHGKIFGSIVEMQGRFKIIGILGD